MQKKFSFYFFVGDIISGAGLGIFDQGHWALCPNRSHLMDKKTPTWSVDFVTTLQQCFLTVLQDSLRCSVNFLKLRTILLIDSVNKTTSMQFRLILHKGRFYCYVSVISFEVPHEKNCVAKCVGAKWVGSHCFALSRNFLHYWISHCEVLH